MSDVIETGGTSGAPAPAPEAPAKTVAYDNFRAVVEAKNNLEAQVAQLKGDLQKAVERGATVDALTGQINEWRSKAEAASARFSTFTELSSVLGTTDTDIIDTFDAKYNALPKTDRPSRADWIGSLKAKPEEAPALLRPWLGAPAQQQQKPPAPRVPGTPATPPGAPSSVSAEEVARVREEAVRTGDWSKWRELSVSMGIRPPRK